MNTIEEIWEKITEEKAKMKGSVAEDVLRQEAAEVRYHPRHRGRKNERVVSEYEEKLCALSDYYERKAFERGVCFAIRLIIDALK